MPFKMAELGYPGLWSDLLSEAEDPLWGTRARKETVRLRYCSSFTAGLPLQMTLCIQQRSSVCLCWSKTFRYVFRVLIRRTELKWWNIHLNTGVFCTIFTRKKIIWNIKSTIFYNAVSSGWSQPTFRRKILQSSACLLLSRWFLALLVFRP
jgi:hypothetical protein